MIDPSHSSAALVSGLQALLGFALGAMFSYCYRIYRRPCQQYWASGFFAMSLFLIFSAIAILLVRPGQSPVSLRGLFSLLWQVFAYLHIGALAIGTLALRAGGSAEPFLTRSAFAAAIVLGAAAWVACAFGPGDGGDRLVHREGLRYVLTAVAYQCVATVLLPGQPWRATAAGQRVVAIAFLCFGIGSLINAAFTSVPGLLESLPNGPWLGLIDLAAVCAIGAGLVIWMHD